MSTRQLGYIVAVLILAAALAAAGQMHTAPAEAGGDQGERTITVSATGRVETAPDTGHVQIGVQTRADRAEDAVQENSRQMNAVISALRDAGIAEEDLSTSQFSVSPVYEHENRGDRRLTGFAVVNRAAVVVRDIDRLGPVIDRAVEAGANTIHSVNLQVSDRERREDDALRLAVERAREKAEIAASEAGQTIVGVKSIQVIDEVRGTPRMLMEEAEVSEVPIMPGQVSVSATVQVVFELGR